MVTFCVLRYAPSNSYEIAFCVTCKLPWQRRGPIGDARMADAEILRSELGSAGRSQNQNLPSIVFTSVRHLYILICLFFCRSRPQPRTPRRPGLPTQASVRPSGFFFVQCGVKGSPCCLGCHFYFDPRAHQLSAALSILANIADHDPAKRRQLSRLRDIGRAARLWACRLSGSAMFASD